MGHGYKNYSKGGLQSHQRKHGDGGGCDTYKISSILENKPIDVVQLGEAISSCKQLNSLEGVIGRTFGETLKAMEKFFEVTPRERLDWAIVVAAYLRVLNLKTNQVRKVLDLSRDIYFEFRGDHSSEERIQSKLMRMRFLLAYSVGKADKKDDIKALGALHKALDPILLKVSASPTRENFEAVYDFIQAVIAYHRFLGGREK
ncbi:type III-A CRISPR-associated protein Csm2 [Thermococcus sp. MV11]|uniref:type III-A CRISPR-associated protein Csm2 n=1 Tax=Thermococcus sp. MV11 TaxID=1638267 RepID=UPI001430DDDE|nr:type III-A CRISPR-associated protein Csm2 [Thermococcus sp. MV11]NJE02962.1 type III-A CRISPR-associated protein Csm2 [Thermococcus sp. MV11]